MIRHEPLLPGWADEALPLLALLGASAALDRFMATLSVALASPPELSADAPVEHPAHLVALGLEQLGVHLHGVVGVHSPRAPGASVASRSAGDHLR